MSPWIRGLLWLSALHQRLLGVYFAFLGPRGAYALTGALGRLMYRLLPALRARAEGQCRAALAGRIAPERVARVAEDSFVHRVWNLADLALAERLLHPATWRRYGGAIPQPQLGDLLDAQRRGVPHILLSAYYGPFDLLPVFLGYNGIRAAALYRRHANAAFDARRRRIRARGGCELVPVEDAGRRLPQILAGGGSVALIADHPAPNRGLPVTFLGLPTVAMRSVGLLAVQYRAPVCVAGIRRLRRSFRFEIDVADVIAAADWRHEDDPVRYITERYLRGLERVVLRDPTQYLWAYARWGAELAAQLSAAAPADARGAG